MRISNISQYLGGADNVIVREIVEGDRNGYKFELQGQGDLSNFTTEVHTELFRANVSKRGSGIRINTFTKVEENLVPGTNGRMTYTDAISEPVDGVATLITPENLLGDLTTDNAPIDVENPFVVVMSVRFIIGEVEQSFRMLWIVRYAPQGA